MRISVAGNRRKGEHGLSLVELLVVLVVIGLLSGVVVLALPEKSADSEKTAYRFSGLVEQMLDRAIIENRPFGMRLDGNRWRAERFTDGDWVLVPLPRSIDQTSEEISLSLVISDEFLLPKEEDENITLMLRGKDSELPPPPDAPPIIFDPVGEVTPFTLMIDDGEERWFVTTERFAETEVRRAE